MLLMHGRIEGSLIQEDLTKLDWWYTGVVRQGRNFDDKGQTQVENLRGTGYRLSLMQ